MHAVARRSIIAALVAASLLGGAAAASAASASAAEPRPAATTAPPPDTPWVTGYYAGWYWDQGYAPDQIDMTAMTHFVFGRVAPGGGSLGGVPGEIVPGAGSAHDPDASPYPGTTVEDAAVGFAHDAGTKALLMLGGDGFDGRGFLASTDDGIRATFVENLVDYLVAHDYDGVDVDWENCIGGEAWECGVDIALEESVRRLTALLTEVRAEMATRARYATQPGIVTYPGYAVSINDLDENGQVDPWRVQVASLVDQYNLMSYGIGTTWNGANWDSWFTGALDGETGTHPISIDSSIEAYVASGVPRDRIGMGIGFYGIYYGPDITGPRQNTDENDIYEVDDNALGYANLVRMGYLDHGQRFFDDEASSTYRIYPGGYVPTVDPARFPAGMLSYEDEQSIAAKGAYTRAGNAGGTILWTLNYGAMPDGSNPLLQAVKESFLAVDASAPDARIAVPDAPESGWFPGPVPVGFAGVDRAGSGIDHLEIRIDGGEAVVVDGDTYSTDVTGDGTHRVHLTAVDGDGGSTSTEVTVRIDGSAPVVEIVSPAAVAADPMAAARADALQPGEVEQGSTLVADFACSDPHSGITSCTGPVADGARLPTTELGAHDVTVMATNGAGLTTRQTVAYRVVPAAADVAAEPPALAATGAMWAGGLSLAVLLAGVGAGLRAAHRRASLSPTP
ncbi:MAG: glycosyl hydrolase family 18 protein [Protaetiibacter sp.]